MALNHAMYAGDLGLLKMFDKSRSCMWPCGIVVRDTSRVFLLIQDKLGYF